MLILMLPTSDLSNIWVNFWAPTETRTWISHEASECDYSITKGLFLESPETFPGPKIQLSNCNPLFW